MGTDDDHERLLRALRAPGSDAELAEEERHRAMFRAAHSPTTPVTSRPRHAPRRLLVGGATAVVLAVGTGGVAAAYSGNLPSPIQTLAHHVIGAPEATSPASSSGSHVPSVTRSPSGPSADPSRSPSARPTHQHSHRPPRPVPASSAPSSAKASTSAPAPSSSASSAPPTSTTTPVLTGVRVVGSSHRADVGARVRFSGQLTHTGTTRSGQRVVLQERVGSRWTPVGRGRSDAGGRITLTAPPLQRTASFRLLAGQGRGSVRSEPWRVAMHPLVSAHVSASKKQATVDVTAAGGFAGDRIALVTRRDGALVVVGQARLDELGSATLVVAPGRRRTSYHLVLDATDRHTSARVEVVVRLAQRTTGP